MGRTWRSVGAVATVVSIATSARADEIEATIYAARKRPLAADGFPGNPDIKRHVFGGGVEWVDAPPEERDGWILRVGAAVEYQADCAWGEPTCPFPSGGGSRAIDEVEYTSMLPDDHVEAGGHARAGYAWRFLQGEAGVLVYSATYAGRYGVAPAPQTSFVPDLVVRVGSRRTFLALGYGSFAAPTMLSPLFYVQGELGFGERWSTTLTAAECELDGYHHERVDVALRYLVTKSLRIGEGLALTYAHSLDGNAFGGEARLHAAWIF